MQRRTLRRILVILQLILLLIILGTIVANHAYADSLHLTCCSDHYNGRQYNESNPGLIYSHNYGENKFTVFGVYKNSEYKTTTMVGVGKRWEWSKDFDFSVSVGLLTGYQRGTVVPYVLPAATYNNFVTVMGLPVDGGAIAVTFTLATWGDK